MKKLILFFLLISTVTFAQTDKYGNYFNVSKMNPAPKGNGSTNDRAVFLKALQTYKSIFIPYTEKGYKIDGNLNIPAGSRLVFDVGAKLVGSGTIIGSTTKIESDGLCFASTLSFSGSFACAYVDRSWFGSDADYLSFVSLNTFPEITIDVSTDTNMNIIQMIGDTAAAIRADIPTGAADVSAILESWYTLTLGNANQYLLCTALDSTHLVIPGNADVDFPVGTTITFDQIGTGTITIYGAGGVTLNAYNGGVASAGQYSIMQIVQVVDDTWTVIGGQ